MIPNWLKNCILWQPGCPWAAAVSRIPFRLTSRQGLVAQTNSWSFFVPWRASSNEEPFLGFGLKDDGSDLKDLADPELIQRCASGDEFALWHLQQRYWPRLLGLIRKRLGDERARDGALVED